ncbi:hypothetical protein Nepgr_011815 [Nepenthes gracilis]|uniref:Uncharacterized protein n=1 Tax=Nepenthes gracilis TaxID=150966 RepID=A0AAD3XML9_NEPGR|nr:hypothetical protein Nepgr_011815 [Nepenthes gracilis]
MLMHKHGMEGIMGDATKIRKRGCSPSSSISSAVQNYRFKRAILVGKKRGGRSTTPVPTWRMVSSRSPSIASRVSAAAEFSPKYPPNQSGNQRAAQQLPPVSARKLAATLWELNEVPSPRTMRWEDLTERRMRGETRRERVGRSVNSGSLPPHLSDPSHSPVSERMNQSRTCTHRRRESSTSRRPKTTDHDVGALDSVSHASLVEIETRSRCWTPAGSTTGVKPRLKDVSNALTTSKELLKIISRMWARDEQPSSSTSLISALHAELERARLQVNQLIHDQLSGQSEINYLLRHFEEEKAAWKSKERETIESAIDSIAGELEVERKLRRRFESLNKKLGKELAETKELFLKALKELEGKKRVKEIIEEEEEMKTESLGMHKEVEKDRRVLLIADSLCKDKPPFEEKNAFVDNIRHKFEAFLGGKEKGNSLMYRRTDGDLIRANVGYPIREGKEEGNDEEAEGGVDNGDDSTESDLHSIELNLGNFNTAINSTYESLVPRNSKRLSADKELKGRKSSTVKTSRRSATLPRSSSDIAEWRGHATSVQAFDYLGIPELKKQAQRKSCGDEMLRYKSVKDLRENGVAISQPLRSRDLGSGALVRLDEGLVEGKNGRRSRQ